MFVSFPSDSQPTPTTPLLSAFLRHKCPQARRRCLPPNAASASSTPADIAPGPRARDGKGPGPPSLRLPGFFKKNILIKQRVRFILIIISGAIRRPGPRGVNANSLYRLCPSLSLSLYRQCRCAVNLISLRSSGALRSCDGDRCYHGRPRLIPMVTEFLSLSPPFNVSSSEKINHATTLHVRLMLFLAY